jgi:hypothetical protein
MYPVFSRGPSRQNLAGAHHASLVRATCKEALLRRTTAGSFTVQHTY